MTNQEREQRLKKLEAKMNLIKAEIAFKTNEYNEIKAEIEATEWVKIGWYELETWLKNNRPQNQYEKNPRVKSNGGSHTSYCKINDDGELQIGAYYHNDFFPRGADLYVTYNFENYR